MTKSLHRIYALSGPDMKPRYIGRTKFDLRVRLIGHISKAKNSSEPFHQWLKALGDEVVMCELERVVCDEHGVGWTRPSIDCETKWIARMLSEGHDLFNKAQRRPPKQYNIISLEERVA